MNLSAEQPDLYMENTTKSIKKILILSHAQEGTTSVDDEFYTYCKTNLKTEFLKLVKFPFNYSKNGSIKTTEFKNNTEKYFESKVRFYKPFYISYIKDILYGFINTFRDSNRYDIVLCTSNLLCLIGIFMKLLGKADKLVFYVIDYTPQRFSNSVINYIYNQIDKLAFYKATMIWTLNEEMLFGRVKQKSLDLNLIKYDIVPFGNHSEIYSEHDYQKNKINHIVYFGGISKEKGSELFVSIAKELIKLNTNDFKIIIMGGGDIEQLKSEVAQNSLDRFFDIKGRINDQLEAEKIMLECGIALAPYNANDKNNYAFYADPGKVKVYLSCGLPVLITDVPPFAKTIASTNSGVIIEYEAKDIALEITKLFANENSYKTMRKNAINLGKLYTWNNIYSKVIEYLYKRL